MKLYLHIGLSKSGTSSIQNFLYEKREILYEKFKILYPETGIFSADDIYAHYNIAFSIYRPDEAKNLVVPEYKELYNQLIDELVNKKPKVCVISSEAFMHFIDDESFQKLKQIIDFFSEKFIVVYLRRQDLWVESSYKQVIKDYGFRIKCQFVDSLEYSLNFLGWLLNYDILLQRWQQAFSDACIIPCIYNRKHFPEKNVILHFLSLLGIDMPEAKEQKMEVNPWWVGFVEE